jgi:hypothetical protein
MEAQPCPVFFAFNIHAYIDEHKRKREELTKKPEDASVSTLLQQQPPSSMFKS